MLAVVVGIRLILRKLTHTMALMRHPARGFSLIELLVVISIVAILAGMLLPVVGAVKDASTTLRCGSHLRQSMLALTSYAVDNRGILPAADGTDGGLALSAGRTWYTTLIATSYLPNTNVTGTLGTSASGVNLGYWMRWPDVVQCPYYRQTAPSRITFAVRWFTSPGMSQEFTSGPGGRAYLRNLRPSMPYLVDSARQSDAMTGGGGYWWNCPNGYSGFGPGVSVMRFGHRGRTGGAAYPDGRAGSFGKAQMLADGVNADAMTFVP
jgi:prepilin-type N-terminal cleavage/methylation domain-containing protein